MKLPHEIDNLFRDKLGNMESPPPHDMWARVENAMDAQKQNRKLILWPWLIAASLLIPLGIGVTLYFFALQPSHNMASLEQPEVTNDIINSNSIVHQSPLQTTTPQTVQQRRPIRTSLEKTQVVTASKTPITEGKPEEMLKLTNKQALLKETYTDNSKLHLKNKKPAQEYLPLFTTESLLATNSNTSRQNIYSIGGQVSPTYSYRTLSNSGTPTRSIATTSNSPEEQGITSLSAGISVSVTRGNRWSFESGIVYLKAGQELSTQSSPELFSFMAKEGNGSIVGVDKSLLVNNSMGTIKYSGTLSMSNTITSSTNDIIPIGMNINNPSISIRQQLEYLEIPLIARYFILDQKTKLSVAAGMSTNILIGNQALLDSGKETRSIGETEGIRNMSYSAQLGLGVQYPMLKHLSISVEPRVRYFLSPVNNSGNHEYRPYLFGIYTGLAYKF